MGSLENKPDLLRAELKDLVGPHRDYEMGDSSSFGYWFDMYIGVAGEDESHQFYIFICTPKWLAQNYVDTPVEAKGWVAQLSIGAMVRDTDKSLIIDTKYMLLVQEYDIGAIWDHIETYCASVTGTTWVELLEELRKFGEWEYEGVKFEE